MLAEVLAHFPPHTHPLTLVHDPDGLLREEAVLAALGERGFRLIQEPDPVHLRYRVEEARPFRAERPVIVVTEGPLHELPYDLWQQGHHVTLALHTFFPNLAYPVVRALSPGQRWRLSQVPGPPRRLGERGTVRFLLEKVFGVDFQALERPAGLIGWLGDYHQMGEPMPPVLLGPLLEHLRGVPAYRGWPLEELLTRREAFVAFVREQWQAYVQRATGQLVSEARVRYVLPFEADALLQDRVPRLVRDGVLEPVPVPCPQRLPAWARPAVLAPDEDRVPRRMAELLAALEEALRGDLGGARWDEWQRVAWTWAECNVLRYDPQVRLGEGQAERCRELEGRLDRAFLAWLRGRYAPLGVKRLPVPHHVHHIPHFLAYERRQKGAGRVALLVLDGLALSDWWLARQVWLARHPDWALEERLVLAQVPTITPISRQALVGGLPPADFADTLGSNAAEPKRWAAFWAREGLPGSACAYGALPPEGVEAWLAGRPHVQAVCLVDVSVDDILHRAGLGAPDAVASLRLWLEKEPNPVEEAVEGLLRQGFRVYLASDHGHVEAVGMGQPSEGLIVETRGHRARVYSDRLAAEKVQQGFGETCIWERDGLLPEGVCALLPEGRGAFAPFGKTVVAHGGATLDEVVVPLVTVSLC